MFVCQVPQILPAADSLASVSAALGFQAPTTAVLDVVDFDDIIA
jgi:hypothetical protein